MLIVSRQTNAGGWLFRTSKWPRRQRIFDFPTLFCLRDGDAELKVWPFRPILIPTILVLLFLLLIHPLRSSWRPSLCRVVRIVTGPQLPGRFDNKWRPWRTVERKRRRWKKRRGIRYRRCKHTAPASLDGFADWNRTMNLNWNYCWRLQPSTRRLLENWRDWNKSKQGRWNKRLVWVSSGSDKWTDLLWPVRFNDIKYKFENGPCIGSPIMLTLFIFSTIRNWMIILPNNDP